MTKRALFISALAVLAICSLGFINDHVLRLERTNNGHQLPIIIIGALFLVAVILNPLLGKLKRRWMFSPSELALFFIITSSASGIPGRALMEQFTQIVTLPHHWVQLNPGWKKREVIEWFPKGTLVTPEPHDVVINGFITGCEPTADKPAGLWPWLRTEWERVPWRQWIPPLVTWAPFMVLTTIAMAAMALIVHRQWSDYEHLQYPIAEFTGALIEQDKGLLYNHTLRNPMFLTGLLTCFIIRVNNGLYQWFPDYVVPVNMWHSLYPFASRWPFLYRIPSVDSILSYRIFPLATAIAFFLPSDISLSLGVTQLTWCVFSAFLVSYGVDLFCDYDIGGYVAWTRAGAYIAFTLMLIYSGRHYYWNLTRAAFWNFRLPRKMQSLEPHAVQSVRLLLLSTIGLCALSMRMGLSWPIAVGNVILMLMTFLIVARISAETGLFFIQPGWQPFGILMVLFGSYAITPKGIFIATLICAVCCIDQAQALMPYITNGLKLGDRTKTSLTGMTHSTVWLYLVGIVVCVAVGIIASYDAGTRTEYPEWSYYRLPTLAIRASEPPYLKLQASGLLEKSEKLTTWQQIRAMRPEPLFCWAAGVGLVGVFLLNYLRLHVRWWALHPLIFLVWCTTPLHFFTHPFFLGWLIKKLSLRFGGNKLVLKLRPMAIGIIAGDILGALLFMIVGVVYFIIVRQPPKSYSFFPR